jgi:hypothetical protein
MKVVTRIVAAMFAVASLCASAQYANAETSTNQAPVPLQQLKAAPAAVYRIHNNNNNGTKCAAIPGASKAQGERVIQWGCGTWPDHYWYFVDAGNGLYKIVNNNSNMCLAIPGASKAQGEGVIQWPCGNWPDHYWYFVDAGNSRYRIVNNNSNMCLAVPGASGSDGVQLIQWPCGDWPDHFWYFTS